MKTRASSKIFILTLFFVILLALTGCAQQSGTQKQINVVFRYDDYSSKSTTEIEQRIIDLFHDDGISITFGVIPFSLVDDTLEQSGANLLQLTPEKEAFLKAGFESGVIDVALHGYTHKAINPEVPSEFTGSDYSTQLEKITEGKKYLESLINAPITLFIPPWNRYDLNTLQALEELGFSTISAGEGGEAPETSKLEYLPATIDLPQIQEAVYVARNSSDKQPLIVVLLHDYDFKEHNQERGYITLPEFSDQVNWLASQSDVRMLSVTQATQIITDLSPQRYLLNTQNCQRIYRYLPVPLHGEACKLQYQEPATLRTILKISSFYLAILLLGFGISFVAGYLIFPRSKFLMNLGTFGSMALSLVVLIYLFHDLEIYLRGMIISTVAVSVPLGLLVCYRLVKKRAKAPQEK